MAAFYFVLRYKLKSLTLHYGLRLAVFSCLDHHMRFINSSNVQDMFQISIGSGSLDSSYDYGMLNDVFIKASVKGNNAFQGENKKWYYVLYVLF